MSIGKEFARGLYHENPVFRLLLGLCPTLAVTTSAINGVSMGLATTAVLLGSNVVIAAIKNLIPKQVRIPSYIIVIATFVTIIGMSLEAFVFPVYQALGLFIPLIVVNCIILGRAEAYASKHGIGASALDAIVIGLGFTLSLGVLGSVRELLGAGSIFGIAFAGEESILGAAIGERIAMPSIFLLAPGAFITLGLLLALINHLSARRGNANLAVAKKEA